MTRIDEYATAEYAGTKSADRLTIRVNGRLRFRLRFAVFMLRVAWNLVWSDTEFAVERKKR